MGVFEDAKDGAIRDLGEKPPYHLMEYPHGGRIAMGESVTPDGPTVYLALYAPEAPLPSLIFWIDPLSHQPMISVKEGEGQRSYPIDKRLVQSPVLGIAGGLLPGL